MCDDTPGDCALGKYVIKISRFDSDTLEDMIIFVDLVGKAFLGQNITTCPPMYKCMERVLKGDATADFTQLANLLGSCIVGIFVMGNGHNDRAYFSCAGLSRPETLHI